MRAPRSPAHDEPASASNKNMFAAFVPALARARSHPKPPGAIAPGVGAPVGADSHRSLRGPRRHHGGHKLGIACGRGTTASGAPGDSDIIRSVGGARQRRVPQGGSSAALSPCLRRCWLRSVGCSTCGLVWAKSGTFPDLVEFHSRVPTSARVRATTPKNGRPREFGGFRQDWPIPAQLGRCERKLVEVGRILTETGQTWPTGPNSVCGNPSPP